MRNAWWYIPSVPSQAKGMPTFGSDSFRAPNPDFGAVITYYLPESMESGEQQRRREETALREAGRDIPFPGWDRLRDENRESAPRVLLLVRDAQDRPVRWIAGPSDKGTHRVAWNLRLPPPDAIDLGQPGFVPPWVGDPQGPLAAPGEYSVQLYSIVGGEIETLDEPQRFAVKPVRAAPDGTDYEIASKDFAALRQDLQTLLEERLKKLEADLLAAGAPSWR